ncbi:hypothetical protein [Winogradskyella ursingii]|uniref:hypothetical protein n=1 Tax=Winogradskyella ursingii TaxID=2686079 RepID=UPI0015CCDFB5|nr:hypothetical protein [Winogradskyella ursingii]
MKRITLLLLLFFTVTFSAQEVLMVKSEIFKDSKKHSNLVFSLEDENGGLITIRSFLGGLIPKLKGYYIQHFDSDLNLIKEIEYEVKNKLIKNAFIKNNQLHLIEFEHDKKSDQIKFNSVSSDIEDLKFSTKEIISFSEDKLQKYFGFGIFPFFIDNSSRLDGNHLGEVVLSSQNNFFVINFDIKNKDKETHQVFVFNTNFEKVYEQLIQKDIKDKFFEYNSIDVDDKDGTVYFLGKSFENKSKKTKKNGKANYHFELYKVNAKGQNKTNFKYADKFISSLELIKQNNRLACVGFYGKKDEGRYNGVCLLNLDPNNLAMQNEKFTPFSEEFMTDKYGDKKGKKERKKKKGVNNIDFRGVYMMANGDIIVNAEEFYVTTHTSMSANGGMRTYSIYHFNDIMSVRLDKDGNLKWARNINKTQTGFTNSSFTSLPVGENLYFFINCSDKIKKLTADRIAFKQTNAKKSNLYMIMINEGGNIDFKKLIDDKESKVYYKVNNGNINIDNQTVILTGKRKKKTRILKLAI